MRIVIIHSMQIVIQFVVAGIAHLQLCNVYCTISWLQNAYQVQISAVYDMYYCRYKLYLVRRCIIMTTDLGLTNTKLGFIILPVPNCTEYTIHLIQYICMHFIHFIHCTLHILYDTLGTQYTPIYSTLYILHNALYTCFRTHKTRLYTQHTWDYTC